MNKSLARGAVVAFVSAASVLPLAQGAQAAAAHDAPSAVSAWTHHHRGFRCDRFGGRGHRWGGDRWGGDRWGVDRWGGDRWGGGGWAGGWLSGRNWWYDRLCGPWGVRWDKRERFDYKRFDYTSIRNSAFVVLR